MANPQPTPSPAPSTGNSLLDSLNAQVDNLGKKQKQTGSLYGLAEWGSQQVNPGDLPITVNLAAGAQQTTGDAIVQAFAHGRPDQIATIQHAMYMAGGYYTGSKVPNWGVLTADDVAAFAKAVKTAGQAGQPVSDLLGSQAAAGAQMGVQAAQQQQQSGRSQTTQITLPNTQDLEAEADAAFEKIVGHKPKPEQAARFAAFYRSMAASSQRAAAQAQYDAANPPVSGALAGADAGQLVQQATGEQVSPFMGPVGRQGAGGVDQSGHLVAPMMGPVAPGQARPWVDPQTGQVAQPDFSSRVGGLMKLGQDVQAAQQQPGTAAAAPGLSFTTADSLPSASTAAENFARNTDPKGAAANDTANVFNTFLGLLSRNFG